MPGAPPSRIGDLGARNHQGLGLTIGIPHQLKRTSTPKWRVSAIENMVGRGGRARSSPPTSDGSPLRFEDRDGLRRAISPRLLSARTDPRIGGGGGCGDAPTLEGSRSRF
ncbi:hypothetical protein BDK51DRAFT_42634 [Blyttiomyces helicus]|uniref:Uncharacterized protein n=1 Tax=Blyttiomyces helicus TaxID=388810 RepID=A0A4P9W973_9FUNG|nr:hypothetical protein BDK51DRAFT_42634 [Blyttiomyces helicus]|eukprot:RKO88045.1 hypothetical protein BDK51DRAFT_42634 [Blyttiomyces helicus]